MPHFVQFTLERSSTIYKAVAGSFTGPRQTEIVASHGKALSLLQVKDTGQINILYTTEAFGLIRCIAPFRLTGGTKDHLAVTSDSGRIVLLDWDNGRFVRLHKETYGKTGVRRSVAGEYLAIDPKGRALLIGGVERQKFVYILNRDGSGRLAIASPLEAHKSCQICFDLCSLDVGFENPVFVSLEASYEPFDSPPKNENLTCLDPTKPVQTLPKPLNPESGELMRPTIQKYLAFWEMDLGLNHVVKKCTISVDMTSNMIIPIPAGQEYEEGPGGVIVCCENYIVFKKPDHRDIVCIIPRRIELEIKRGILISTWTIHKMKNFYFILLQTELGDLFRLEFVNEGPVVKELILRYFDTIPIASSLCILKNGFLFAASQTSDHILYQFTGIGSDEQQIVSSSNNYTGAFHPGTQVKTSAPTPDADHSATAASFAEAGDGSAMAVQERSVAEASFVPMRPKKLSNLIPIMELKSLGPLIDLKVIDCIGDATQTPQIYALIGSGPRSRVSILRQGLSCEQIACSELPAYPNGIWTIPLKKDDPYHKFIFLSFNNSTTLILEISDSIEEFFNSSYITDRVTLLAACLMDDSHVQVAEDGWRLIRPKGDNAAASEVYDWKVPTGKRVLLAVCNSTQLVLAVSGGLIMYFVLDATTHQLREKGVQDLGHEVTAIALPPLLDRQLRSNFVAVGGLDRSVRLLSLDESKVLFRQLSVQMLPSDSHAESLAVARLPFSSTEPEVGQMVGSNQMGSYSTILFVGLSTGVLIRLQIDPLTGQMLGNRRQKFLGSNPVRLTNIDIVLPPSDAAPEEEGKVQGQRIEGVGALTSKCWLSYGLEGVYCLRPLIIGDSETADYVASLNSVHCMGGLVLILNKLLKIIKINYNELTKNQTFSETRIPLDFTPRKSTVFPPPPSQQERQDSSMKNQPIMLLPPSPSRPWYLATIEGDHNTFDLSTKVEIQQALKSLKTVQKQQARTLQQDADQRQENLPQEGNVSQPDAGGSAVVTKAEDAEPGIAEGSHTLMKGEPEGNQADFSETSAAPAQQESETPGGAEDHQENAPLEDADDSDDEPDERQVGTYEAGDGRWGGALRLIRPSPPSIAQTIPFAPDECPTAIAVCQFLEYPQHPALVVGTVTGLNLKTRKCQSASLKVYVYDDQGLLTLHHSTPVEDVPLALCAWSGRLLASVGPRIRIYVLGRKRLLKRCEYKNLPVGVNWLRVFGNRVFAADVREGFHVLRYSATENTFSVAGDMTTPRWVTCGEVLDQYTIVGGDKFNNIFVQRLPPGSNTDAELYDTTGLKVRGDTAYITGQTSKLDRIAEFHLGDTAMAVQKCMLSPGGCEVVIFGTIGGSLGVLLPLQTAKEVEFLQHLEMLMRNEDLSIVGRDHAFFRSANYPVKNVVDGDLLEFYSRLRLERQLWLAQQLEKTPPDICKILDDLRGRII